jgi:hypothetical protein
MIMTHGLIFGVHESSHQNKPMKTLLGKLRHRLHSSGFGSHAKDKVLFGYYSITI